MTTPPDGAPAWGALPKDQRPWLVARDQIGKGVRQRFESGSMLFLVESDCTRTIQLVGAGGAWWQSPDLL